LPHIPREAFPGLTLSAALYLEGAIRATELRSVAFTYTDPTTGERRRPPLELVRLALPRRVYTQAYLDFVALTFRRVREQRASLPGYRFTYAPELLRHFTARFKPI
jgi:tryptophanase